MTLAVCFNCGEEKFGSLVPCECGVQPTTENELAWSILLSEWHMSLDELRDVAQQLKLGKALPQLDPETIEALIPPANEREVMLNAE
jgi:hypothetical protein